MGLFTPDIDTLRELYTTKLKMALNAENQIVEKGLPTMIENATNPEVADAFRIHLEESKDQASRLESILAENEGEVDDTKCAVMTAIISEGSATAKAATDDTLRDIVLLAAGNEVEHHEIAIYGTLVNYATILGESRHAQLLQKSLEEEKNADAILTALAEQINVQAVAA